MDNSVIIVLCCAALAAWIAWLIYNYAVFNKQVSVEAKVDYWKGRVKRVRNCINDLVEAIHNKFPKSTVQYNYNDDFDNIEGEIKY